MTDPDGTVALGDVVTVPTNRPAAVKSVVAVACVSLTTDGTVTNTGPVETTRLTAVPTTACVPPAGLWLMTDPDVTVELDAVVMVPTVRPAVVKVVVATACAVPTTLGTVTCGGPVETTRLTALPDATGVPLAGFWLMTSPAATVVLDDVVTVPTVRPAVANVIVAAVCVVPTTEGTVIATPKETTIATELPAETTVPLPGFWLIINPAVTVVLNAEMTVPSLSPAFVKVVVAAVCVAPTTEGTVTVDAARISTMLRLYLSPVGAVSLIVTVAPLRGVGLVCL
jgi:hypothetical protein